MIKIDLPNLDRESYRQIMIGLIEVDEFDMYQNKAKSLQNPVYKAWNKVKYEAGFNTSALWGMLSDFRRGNQENLPIKTESGDFFKFWELPRYRKFFHEFDRVVGGKAFQVDSLHERVFIQNGILEESIQSSRIEGAVTTRKDAQKMIRENRKARNKSEQMILNNYETIQRVQQEWKNQPLSLPLLFEMHFSITKNADLAEEAQYRLRKNKDEVDVWDNQTDEIVHACPDEKFLETEINRLIAFANDELDTEFGFLHPLVKAIMLHFWIGYLHPFVDGNGRTARALFYWYLLRNGYWGIPFIPISRKIIDSQKQYRDAFLFTEQIDYDFNYFLDYNLRKINEALDDFVIELEKVKSEKDQESGFLQQNFSPRQIELLKYFWRHPKRNTTFSIHQNFHSIHSLTARKDLGDLEKKGYLSRKKVGKTIYFFPEEKIEQLFQ